MTATDELRRLLDERGVEYDDSGAVVYFEDARGYRGMAYDAPRRYGNGMLCVHHTATPAQAIAATLGAGTCKDVCNSVSEFTCSVCGFNCDLTSWISLFDGDDGRHRHHHHGTPNFCPNCGRKVVDE